MARPKKTGLDYFPFDVDTFENDKVFELQNEYGPLGEAVYLRLLCLVYKNGYYYRFDTVDKLANLVIRSVGSKWATDRNTVREIIFFCGECGLFSQELMQQNVITSLGIQLRFLKAKERSLPKIEEYSLISDDSHPGDNAPTRISAPETGVIAAQTGVIAAETPDHVYNNPTKESKEKKSISEESKAEERTVNESTANEITEKNKENYAEERKAAAPPLPIPNKLSLVRKYGELAVTGYELKYISWQQRHGISGALNYSTIAKWMTEDGVPEYHSSIDTDDIMEELRQQYSMPEL